MMSANELQESQAQIQLALAAAETVKTEARPAAKELPQAVAVRVEGARQLNLSGAQVLITLALSLCMVSVFTWAFVRHWLFAP